MSLILDALKKLERDRSAPDPGVVVVGALPWEDEKRPRRGPVLVVAALLGVAAIGSFGWWLGARSTRAPGGAPAPAAASVITRASAPAADSATSSSDPATTSAPVTRPAPTTTAEPVTTAAAVPADAFEAAAVRQRAVEPAVAPVARRLVLPPEDTPTAAAEQPPAASTPAAAERPTVAAVPGRSPELQLMAISRRDGQPIAIISDHMVREGDSFDGVTVVRIGEAEVEVEVRGRRRILRF